MREITRKPARTVTRSRGAWVSSLAADGLTMIIGLAMCVSVKLIGTIPGGEIVVMAALPVLVIVRFKKLNQDKLRNIFLFLGLWLVGQVATDIYRGTSFVNWAKGDSAVVFMAMDLAALAALVGGSERRKAIFIFSFSLGSILGPKISPTFFFEGDPWKFGYGLAVTSLVVLASCWFYGRRQYAVVGMLLLGITGVHLILNYRSPVLFLLVTIGVVIPVIPERIGRLRVLPPQGTGARIIVLAVVVMVTGGVARLIVTGLSASGALGEEARLKNDLQQNSTLGLLIGARPEILVSSRAVWDSPILGHGSFANDLQYLEMYRDQLIEIGMREGDNAAAEQNQAEIGTIPAHSHLMGAWVFGGVLGAVFWGYILYLVMRGTIRATMLRPTLLPIYCYLCTSFMWDILFSPFGYSSRITEAFVLVVVCDLLSAATSPALRPINYDRRRPAFAQPVRRSVWSHPVQR